MLLQHPKTVKFNPANKAHRSAIRAFMKRRAWADSPIRFSHDPAYGSVVEQVQTLLLEWYLNREATPRKCKTVAPVVSSKVSQLKKKA